MDGAGTMTHGQAHPYEKRMHEICMCILNMYNLHKIFVEYDGEFYLKKMKKDDITLGAAKGTDKMKMFSKVVIPIVNSMMHDTRYSGLRL